jgi:uncharacterized protein DUF6328
MTSEKSEHREEEAERIPLSRAAQYLLEECRMVLPGIQALFGFQLIVVFHPTFAEKLNPTEQTLHLVAIGLIAASIAIIMAPAAYHRQTSSHWVTAKFIRLSTRLLLLSMGPLAVSISIEFYLVGRIITGASVMLPIAVALLALFGLLWIALPRVRGLERLLSGNR